MFLTRVFICNLLTALCLADSPKFKCTKGEKSCFPMLDNSVWVECINEDKWCDGNPDCPNPKNNPFTMDEIQCEECKNGSFHCDDSKCVPHNKLCDQHKHCRDGKDELICLDRDECQDDHFYCPGDRKCLQLRFRCNGLVDCPADKADELSCTEIFCLGTNRKLCHADKKCIDKAGWCNRYPDCSDGEDERECNVEVCKGLRKDYCQKSNRCIPYGSKCYYS